MDFDGEQNSFSGQHPDFGAIFMSNSATKQECFRRKIFGLPSSQANFVKQVKAGMVLFLFEFERRELYGVFQASSNGAMNIALHAFRSSGKQFPAQIEFTTIWHCSPLSEHEFCDAIKDNYFSANKFNFGLSKDQVHQLLLLFSSRKSRNQLPLGQLMRSKVPKLIGNSFGKDRRKIDDDKFVSSDRAEIERDMGNDLGPVISSEYPRNSLAKEERVHVDGRLATSDRVANGADNDIGPIISTDYFGNSLGKGRRVADGGRFATSDKVENECNVYNVLGSVNLTEYPGLCQSNLNSLVYSTNSMSETNYSLIQGQLMPSAIPCSMEHQSPNLSYSTSHADAVVSGPPPYDPDAPGIQYRHPSSFGVSHSSNSVKGFSPYNSSVGNISPSPRNESFQLHVESKGIHRNPDNTCGVGNYVPLPTPNHCNCYYCMTSIPFSRTGDSENRVVNSSDFEGYKDLPLSKLSFSPTPISRSKNYRWENMYPSAYSSSPRKKSPFFVSDYEYPVVSHDKNERKTPWRESNEALTANFLLSNQDKHHLQGCVDSFESRSAHIHESNSFKRDIEHPRKLGGLYSDFKKQRNSVFSRLTPVPKILEQENDTSMGDDECSADEVMDMLHQVHYHEVKKIRNSKPSNIRPDDVEKLRNKKQSTFQSQTARVRTVMLPVEMNMDRSLDSEGSGNSMAEGPPLVNFKRRSEVRKSKDGTKKTECVSYLESEGMLGMPPKRRKLVRPNFSNSETSHDKEVNGDSSPNLQGSYQESSVSKDVIGSREALVRSQENENKLSLYIGLKRILRQFRSEDNSTNMHGSSNLKGEISGENYGDSLRSGGQDGKELGEVGTENVLFSDSCEDDCRKDEEVLGTKDTVVGELSLDYNTINISNVKEPSSGIGEGDSQSKMTFVAADRGGSNEKLFQVVENVNEVFPVSCEITIGQTKNSSSNQGLKLERPLEELVDICVDGEGKGNKHQLSLGSGTEQSKASFDTQESCHKIIDRNVRCAEQLVTTNSVEGSGMGSFPDVETLNVDLPCYQERTIEKSKTISTDQNSKLP